MKKKIIGVFGLVLIMVIFVLPLNSVLAKKPVPILFYGIPALTQQADVYDAGQSGNRFMIWTDLPWTFCWDYDIMEVAPGVFMPVSTDDLAIGVYDGKWIMHKFVPPATPEERGTFESITTWGRHTVEVVDWEEETGEFVLQGVGNRWTIISGTIGGMTLHGVGTVEQVIDEVIGPIPVWKYEGTVQFT